VSTPTPSAHSRTDRTEEHIVADNITLTAESRTEFGKGAARRLRRDWKVPAVLYGHGTDPVHMALPSIEFARVLRAHGTNAVLTITVDGSEHLALVKTVVVHPLRNYIEHADLLVIRRGEKVTIDVTVVIVGDAEPGSLVTQDATTVQVEAERGRAAQWCHAHLRAGDADRQRRPGPVRAGHGGRARRRGCWRRRG